MTCTGEQAASGFCALMLKHPVRQAALEVAEPLG